MNRGWSHVGAAMCVLLAAAGCTLSRPRLGASAGDGAPTRSVLTFWRGSSSREFATRSVASYSDPERHPSATPGEASSVPPSPAARASPEFADVAPVGFIAAQPPSPPDGAPAEELPAPMPTPAPAPLTLAEVLQSVERSYPLLEAAAREYQIAAGRALAAWGKFDLNVEAQGIAGPLGFYQTYRNGVTLSQPLWRGGYAYGGYRIGDGDFPAWYGDRETDEGGEFRLGLAAPLLQGRAIDPRRADVRRLALARDAVVPKVETQRLQSAQAASYAYWTWVEAGLALELQRELLSLAQLRVRQIEERIRVGDLERIAGITNQQLIAAREARVIEAERKLQEAAINLSLFLRTPRGEPITPSPDRLPKDFPPAAIPDPQLLERDVNLALAARPELQALELELGQVRVELAQAENQLLPKLEARVESSKDVGAPASPKRDKTPLELEAGIFGEVPLQRREAQGKVRAAQGKLAQLTARRQFAADRVAAEVQDAYSALRAAAERSQRARSNVELARQSLELGRAAFEAGDIDVVVLNLYEQAVADAQLSLLSAEADFFRALADYRAALALPTIP